MNLEVHLEENISFTYYCLDKEFVSLIHKTQTVTVWKHHIINYSQYVHHGLRISHHHQLQTLILESQHHEWSQLDPQQLGGHR